MNKPLPHLFIARFFLSLFVVLYHIPDISATMGLPYGKGFPFLQKGLLAVYYFFSLSGFLIIRLIYLEIKNTAGFDFKQFYLRRMQRLYPVYYLVLITGVLLYHFLLPLLKIDFEIGYRLPDLFTYYVFFVPNVFKYYHPEIGGILIVLWSIGVEEQFYLFIPLVMYLGRKKIVSILLLLLAASLLMLFFFQGFYRYDNLYFYFILGGIMAIVSERNQYRFFQFIPLQVVVYGLVAVSFFTNLFSFQHMAISHLVNLTVSTCFFTMIAYYPPVVIKNKAFDYLGKISYGIYMYHMIAITGIVFVLARMRLARFFSDTVFIVFVNVLVVLVTILLAHISYQFFEKRFYQPKTDV